MIQVVILDLDGVQAAKAGGMTALAVGDARKSARADKGLNDIRELLALWN